MSTKEQLRKQWAERITEFRSSGMTMAAWCSVNKCSIEQLKYWLYRAKHLSSSAQSSTLPIWAPHSVVQHDPLSQSSLVVRVGKCCIDVQPGFDPDLLRDVIRVLEEI